MDTSKSFRRILLVLPEATPPTQSSLLPFLGILLQVAISNIPCMIDSFHNRLNPWLSKNLESKELNREQVWLVDLIYRTIRYG